jgi:Tol biopolymer transport system component
MCISEFLKKNLLLKVIVSLAIFVFVSVSCSPSYRPFGLVFSANLDGNQDLYRVYSHDFQSLERLTHTSSDREQKLRLSRDDTKILYTVLGEYLGWDTYVLDLNSNKITSLENPDLGLRSIQALTWSSDGNIAVLLEKQKRKIYLLNLDQKNVEELDIPQTFDGSIITAADYSPDGKKIIYTEYQDSSPQVSISTPFIFNFETNEVAFLVENNNEICIEPKWSSDGQKILTYCFITTTSSSYSIEGHVYLLGVKDYDPIVVNKVADLPCGYQIFWSPKAKYAWAPDGKQFVTAYCQMGDVPLSLAVFDSEGNLEGSFPVLESTQNEIFVTEMVWSPDSKKIIYIAGESENKLNIYMINPDGSSRELLTNQSANYEELNVFGLDT